MLVLDWASDDINTVSICSNTRYLPRLTVCLCLTNSIYSYNIEAHPTVYISKAKCDTERLEKKRSSIEKGVRETKKNETEKENQYVPMQLTKDDISFVRCNPISPLK